MCQLQAVPSLLFAVSDRLPATLQHWAAAKQAVQHESAGSSPNLLDCLLSFHLELVKAVSGHTSYASLWTQ